MLVKKLEDCEEGVALDDSLVRELLNPHDNGPDLKLNYSLAYATVKPGRMTLPHRFKKASEVYYIVKGKGVVYINEQAGDVYPGDTVYIPPMATQYIENKGQENLEFLCIVYPPWQPDAEELV
jgi:mannose-6-phosphate isomerase-like protein (cupin superfamily)